MSNKKEELSEEDYLKRHLGDMESGKNNAASPFASDIPFGQQVVVENTRVEDLQYFNCDIRELPCGRFYPIGTLFMVRPAKVKEIQAYSMVDDSNFYDIVEKMNDMLKACVRIKYPDGKIGSFLEVRDQDRLFLIFLIRELTFQQGNSLTVPAKNSKGEEVQIELTRKNFEFHPIDPVLEKHFNPNKSCYSFETKNGGLFEITPPTIGLQKAFTDYIIKENNDKVSPNLSFLKIIPFMLGGRTSITYDGIKAKLSEFEQMDDMSFQFLNAAVGKMTFGIKELKKDFDGEEVRAEMQFPNGTSGIFVIHDAFEAYIKE
jgi:hypothetical protein